MPKLPTDGFAAAQFVMRHLCRPVELVPGRVLRAAAETAQPMGGDDWIWTDDNAKLLEFVSRPEIWSRFPGEAADMLRFVEAMCRGPFIFRRLGTPRLERTDGTYPIANYVHSLMHFRTDLPRGAVMAGVRFHDGRTADNLMLGGNAVEFTCNGRRTRLSVAEAITDTSSEQHDNVLMLRHSGELYFKRRLRRTRLGRITYVYTIDARSMLIGVEAVLEVDSAAPVSDVVMTIGHDQLSHGQNSVFYNAIAANRLTGGPAAVAAGEPAHAFAPLGGASYYSIAQAEIAGFALAVHTRPRQPERLLDLETVVRARGWLHLVSARYRFAGDCRGARLVVGEDKMLTAGGFYDRIADYDELLRSAVTGSRSGGTVIDYSVSYDYGAEIDAFAKCFAVCTSGSGGEDAAELTAVSKNLFDTYLGYYDECFVAGHYQNKNTIMSRQLAFVVLGLATMYRATQAAPYLDKLKELTNVLLDFEVRFDDVDGTPASGFPYGMHSQRFAWVDGQSAALTALTQAARFIDDPRFAATIERGIGSYCLETCGAGQPPRKVDLVSTAIVLDGIGRHTEHSYWNFNVGLALRFFNALRASPVAELRAIAERHRERLALLELVMHRQIERSITEHDDSIEIRTALYAGETNSETQPWVMLGLLGHPYD